MGRINEYQRKQLVSRAVGVAPADRSGQIVGAAVTKVGNAMIQQAQKMEMFEQVQANSAIMDFSTVFTTFDNQLKTEMAPNPAGYPEKLQADGEAMINNCAVGIENDNVRGKFVSAANTVLRAAVARAPIWQFEQSKSNTKVAIQQGLISAAQITGMTDTKQAFVTSMQAFMTDTIDPLTDMDEPTISVPEVEKEIRDKGLPTFEAHLLNRLQKNAKQLDEDLYSPDPNINYNDIPWMTAKLKETYHKKALAQIKWEEEQIKISQTSNFYKYNEKMVALQLSIPEIRGAQMAVNPAERITQAAEAKLLSGVVKQNLAEAKKMKNDGTAKRYVELVEKVFDDLIDRSTVLGELIDVWRDGEIDTQEEKYLADLSANLRETLTARKADNALKSIAMIKDKGLRIWGRHKSKVIVRTAARVQELVGGMMSGVSPDVIVRGILNSMNVEKVLSEYPSLATFEDPVAEAYKQVAVEALKEAGQQVTDNNIAFVVENLRGIDNKEE